MKRHSLKFYLFFNEMSIFDQWRGSGAYQYWHETDVENSIENKEFMWAY